MKKTFLLFFMAFACLVASYAELPEVFSYTDASGIKWEFILRNNEAYIFDATKDGNAITGMLNIPGSVEKNGTPYTVVSILGFIQYGTNIRSSHLKNNDGITGITFPPSLKTIGMNAFFNDRGITSLIIPSTVKSVQGYAFYNCSSLASLTIENGVDSIGPCAFYNGTSLYGDLTIPASIKHVGTEAFVGCPFGGTLTVLAQQYSMMDNNYNPPLMRRHGVFDGSGAGRLQGPFTHVVLGGEAPSALGAGKIDLMANGWKVFDLSHATSITFLPEVKKIAPYAFAETNISNLALTIPEGIEEIGEHAFYRSKLNGHVTIPSTVNTMGDFTFAEAKGLTEITLKSTSLSKLPQNFASLSENLEKVSLPDNITAFGKSCFDGCTALTDIQMPAHLTEIGYRAFAGCTGLHGDVGNFVPSTLQYLGVDAFADNMGITGEAILPANIKLIGPETVDHLTVGNPFTRTGVYGIRMSNTPMYFGAAPNENPKTNWTNWGGYAGLLYLDTRFCGLNLNDYKHQGYKAYKFTREADCEDEEAYRNFGGIAVNGLIYLPPESLFQRTGFPDVTFAERFKAFEFPDEFEGENFIMDGKCQHFYVQDGLDYRVPIAFTAIEARCSRIFSNTAGLAVSTLYLPYPTDLPDGMKAYSLSFKGLDINGDKAFHFAPVPAGTRLEANHPYLIQITDGQSHRLPTMHNVEVPVSPNMEASAVMATSDADWKFYGTTERLDNAKAYDKKAYYLSGNKWWAIENGVENNFIAPFRCFITSPTGAVPAKSFIMVLEDDTATSVNKLEKDTESDIQSGRYEFYSVDGLRMGKDYDKLQSGQIYIVNGKKFYKL